MSSDSISFEFLISSILMSFEFLMLSDFFSLDYLMSSDLMFLEFLMLLLLFVASRLNELLKVPEGQGPGAT
jgi:hypothetical protein